MTSVAQNAGLDALIILKITHDGVVHRASVPLRDISPTVLEEQMRKILRIPSDARFTLERYSDSAAAYVLLDPANNVCKQLHRAARAKGKLKLRITLLGKSVKADLPDVDTGDAPPSPETPAAHASTANEAQALTSITTFEAPLTLDITSHSQPELPDKRDTHKMNDICPINSTHITSPSNDMTVLANDMDRRLQLESHETEHASPNLRNKATEPDRDSKNRISICCNNCERNIPDSHYHCSTCDDGDLDLCQPCIDQGITCYGDDHWLIKRTMKKNGHLEISTTETIKSKPKTKPSISLKQTPRRAISLRSEKPGPVPKPEIYGFLNDPRWPYLSNIRTCNCCVQEFPEREFLHCTACEDFDLCKACFLKDAHGHHPDHGFVPAVSGAQMSSPIKSLMAPGRNQMHHAICDGCDKYIVGVRFKCLDCPDWDFCSACVPNAHFVHPNHRFVPVYKPIPNTRAFGTTSPIHIGVCCDGPLCSISQSSSYIRGVRYKCTVCHDLDFCANCEASPSNSHNKTHPLIKINTPIRYVSVNTVGEHPDGRLTSVMRDVAPNKANQNISKQPATNSINVVQTVVDVKPVAATMDDISLSAPTEIHHMPEPQQVASSDPASIGTVKTNEIEQINSAPNTMDESSQITDLRAVFIRDKVADGTILSTNHVFEQTWVLRNEGNLAWLAGCSVKFVGGDYMGHVDSAHPAGISELVSASESTVCYDPLLPGQEFSFTALLRTSARPGKIISYWRLTNADGHNFGHRLWCEINVCAISNDSKPEASVLHVEDIRQEQAKPSTTCSMMIFPKLENESAEVSSHGDATIESPKIQTDVTETFDKEFEYDDCGEDECDLSENGYLTDEEYDVLDASDEEFLEQQSNFLNQEVTEHIISRSFSHLSSFSIPPYTRQFRVKFTD